MTALNWEKNSSRYKQKGYIGNELPITGSYADQRRYGVYSSTVSRTRAHLTAPGYSRSRSDDFEQLRRYSEHAFRSDVKRLTAVQKDEILRIIRSLLVRCNSWEVAISTEESNLMDRTNFVIKKWRH